MRRPGCPVRGPLASPRAARSRAAFIYARFIGGSGDIFPGGTLFEDDDEEIAVPDWVTPENPYDPAPMTENNEWHPGRTA